MKGKYMAKEFVKKQKIIIWRAKCWTDKFDTFLESIQSPDIQTWEDLDYCLTNECNKGKFWYVINPMGYGPVGKDYNLYIKYRGVQKVLELKTPNAVMAFSNLVKMYLTHAKIAKSNQV